MSSPCKMILRMQCSGIARWLSLIVYYYLYGHLQGPVYKTLQTLNLQQMVRFHNKLESFPKPVTKHTSLDKNTRLYDSVIVANAMFSLLKLLIYEPIIVMP